MGGYGAYQAAALKQPLQIVRDQPLAVAAPAVGYVGQFQYQSYFSSTLLEKAVKTQRPGDQIIDPRDVDVDGYAVALHPASETPVAIEFKNEVGGGKSGLAFLAPGQVLEPAGGRFKGLRWGLPFGWLGGGLAQLIVFTAPGGTVNWGAAPDVLFHRLRLPIVAPGGGAANWKTAWPLRFPWINAYASATTAPQGGQPSIYVVPTRVELRVRIATEHDAIGSIRAYMRATEHLDRDSSAATDTVGTTDVIFTDVAVPSYVRYPTSVDTSVANPYAIIEIKDGPLVAFGGDSCAINLVDISAGGELAGVYVDILRYGRLC